MNIKIKIEDNLFVIISGKAFAESATDVDFPSFMASLDIYSMCALSSKKKIIKWREEAIDTYLKLRKEKYAHDKFNPADYISGSDCEDEDNEVAFDIDINKNNKKEI